MSNRELFLDVQAVVDANESTLANEQQAANAARQKMVDASSELSTAEVALEEARVRVDTAKNALVESQLDVGAAHNHITDAARELAALIIRSSGDDVPRTLFGLIYYDDTLARNDEAGTAYTEAAKKGETALTAIMDRLQPGEPVLHVGGYEIVVGVVPDRSPLVATPPRALSGQARNTVAGGSLDLWVTKAVRTTGKRPFVTTEILEDQTINLISDDPERNVERLVEAGENTAWLVIGNESIAKALEKEAEPWGQFVALTALKEIGIDVPFVLDEEFREETTANLIALITYVATGELASIQTKPEVEDTTITIPIELEAEDLFVSLAAEPVDEDPMAAMEFDKLSREVSGRSMKNMAHVLGLDKETVRAGVMTILKSLANSQGGVFTPELNAPSVDRILVDIFDS